MKIELMRVGSFTCLPLPEPAAEARGYAPGDLVDVAWDETRRRLAVRPLAEARTSRDPAPATGELGLALDEFLEQYSDALTELAADDHSLPHGG